MHSQFFPKEGFVFFRTNVFWYVVPDCGIFGGQWAKICHLNGMTIWCSPACSMFMCDSLVVVDVMNDVASGVGAAHEWTQHDADVEDVQVGDGQQEMSGEEGSRVCACPCADQYSDDAFLFADERAQIASWLVCAPDSDHGLDWGEHHLCRSQLTLECLHTNIYLHSKG